MTKHSKKNEHNDSPKVKEFKERFSKEGEHLVHDVFPQRILDLDELFQTLSKSDLSEINTDLNIPVPDSVLFSCNHDGNEPGSKKRKIEHVADGAIEIPGSKVLILPNGPCPTNKNLLALSEQLKPQIRDLVDHANTVKMWISFLIPKIEDGNNFGVSIQEETLSEARQVESEAASYLDQISRYYITRGKLVSKVAKYPHIEDYRQSIREIDEKQFISLRLICCELRNNYASLHDLINKNIDKIRKPRNANAESLY